MEQADLNKIIEQARLDRSTSLNLRNREIAFLPESIGNLVNLTDLYLYANQLSSLPESIGHLVNLTYLNLGINQLNSLPESIGNLVNLTELHLNNNQLTSLPESIGNLVNLTHLDLGKGQMVLLSENIGNLANLTILPESIDSLFNSTDIFLRQNQLTILPESIINLANLYSIKLCDTLEDLSILQDLPSLEAVEFMNVNLPRRYWTKLSEWKSEWLLDENNAEIRRALIAQIGYEKICHELNAVTVNTWREYTLLKIDGLERVYDDNVDVGMDLGAGMSEKLAFGFGRGILTSMNSTKPVKIAVTMRAWFRDIINSCVLLYIYSESRSKDSIFGDVIEGIIMYQHLGSRIQFRMPI